MEMLRPRAVVVDFEVVKLDGLECDARLRYKPLHQVETLVGNTLWFIKT